MELSVGNLIGRSPPRFLIAPLFLDYARCEIAIEPQWKEPISVAEIRETVCVRYGITREQILSTRRCNTLVLPRHIAFYLTIVLTPHSYSSAGRLFRRDHTTMMHAVRKITKMRRNSAAFDQAILELIVELGG